MWKPDYPLDMVSPVQHVATKLEGAERPLSIAELAEDYRHAIAADLGRIERWEGRPAPYEATRFLIERAVESLGKAVEQDGNGYRLVKDFDSLRFRGRKLHRAFDDTVVFRDAFNPMSGEFAINSRDLSDDKELDNLRVSMKTVGWLDGYPAIVDERGVVLAGHRRLKVAEELGIEKKILRIDLRKFKFKDLQDDERVRYALFSNVGTKVLTPSDKKRWAKYLGNEAGWSIVEISQALQMNRRQIERYLKDESSTQGTTHVVSSVNDVSKPKEFLTDEQQVEVVRLHFDEGLSYDTIAERLGCSDRPIRRVIYQEEGRRKALAEIANKPEPVPEPVLPGPELEVSAPVEPEPEPESVFESEVELEIGPEAEPDPPVEPALHIHVWRCGCGATLQENA